MYKRQVLGKEPIIVDGRAVGYVTSADMGYSVGKYIAYGYLPAALATTGQPVEIVYFGQPLRATVADDPLFDSTTVSYTHLDVYKRQPSLHPVRPCPLW